jgi:hypothetical protein
MNAAQSIERGSIRLLVLAMLLAGLVPWLSANQKLYLTDGSYHVVREYKVLEDRVRFYSTERSQWEEIPKELIDFARTEGELGDRLSSQAAEQALLDEEEAIERRMRRAAAAIPNAPGVYLFEDGSPIEVPIADTELVNDRQRSFLKVITPVPMIASRNWVEIKGLHSQYVLRTPRPEFYIRLHTYQTFGFFRLLDHRGNRVVQTWERLPVTNQIIEEQEEVEDFRRQAGPMLYQIWPREELEPGEYALVTYSPGEANIRVWDFSYQIEGKPVVKPAKYDPKIKKNRDLPAEK